MACSARSCSGTRMRQRGNDFVEHEPAGKPPLLHFEYEMVVDGRTLERPVNYALVRIMPPEGVDGRSDAAAVRHHRSRAPGTVPGIGGFKDDSQVGVALRAGHPVYFVIFFRDPEPGPDAARRVRRRGASSCATCASCIRTAPKPAIVGNCQGGWAAMMLAAADPDDTGPIVINGAPMSYWGGAWSEGEGDNPMRYAGGMLGGTLARLAARADLGDGMFDGAYLVQNFENLNPANTFWDKYYHLFANVDTEPPRFLEFERWWGGFYLMNREEIELDRSTTCSSATSCGPGDAQGRPAASAFDLRDDQRADHPVRVDGRQHHAAAAGVQLGRRRLRQHRGDQGARPGDRRPAARGHRPPRHLRLRQGREEGARADRLGAEVDRGAAARPVRRWRSTSTRAPTARSSTRSTFARAPARGHRRRG